MDIATIDIAETTLPQCLARGKTPIAKLVPFKRRPSKRLYGAMRGVVNVGPEFFEPLSEEELTRWE